MLPSLNLLLHYSTWFQTGSLIKLASFELTVAALLKIEIGWLKIYRH